MHEDNFIQAHADIVIRALRLQSELDQVVRRLTVLSVNNSKRKGIGKIQDVMVEAELVMDSLDKNIAALRALLPEFSDKEEKDGK